MMERNESGKHQAAATANWARTIGLGIVVGAVLVSTGCVQPDRRLPVAELRSRILPPTTQPATTQPTTRYGAPTTVSALLPEHPISLDEAIEIAYRGSPALRLADEAIEEARAGKDIARSAFLPQATAGYGYNWRNRQPGSITRGLPVHIGIEAGERQFQQAEVVVQMTVWDFGRSLSRYEQAKLGVDVTQLQYDRLRETIAFQVTDAYFAVLRAQQARVIARDAVNQAEAHLKTARSFFRQGVVDKNDVLRAEVQVNEMRQALVTAENAVEMATAALNRVLGINVNRSTEVIDVESQPAFTRPFVDCLELAVAHRREFEVVQKAILAARYGLSAAQAEYLPRIFVAGSLSYIDDDFQLEKTIATGTVGIQLDLYTGGRRTAKARAARARTRQALEAGRQVCDGIAFQVKEAYLSINESRERIALSTSAVAQAEENLRLINNKYAQTAATPTDVVDAETLVTRSRQNYHAAVYDYLVAVERLKYAMGTDDDDLEYPACTSQPEAQGLEQPADSTEEDNQ